MADIFNEFAIQNQKKVYEVPEGTVILSEGEISLDMYKIVSGHCEMYTGYGTDDEVLIGMLCPGTCFGEFGILTGKPAIYTIIAYSKLKILRVTEGLMGEFIKENQDSILGIMRNMATSMMRMQNEITQLNHELVEIRGEEQKSKDPGKENLRSYAVSGANKQLKNDPKSGMKYLKKDKKDG